MSQVNAAEKPDPVAVLHGELLQAPGGIKGAAEAIGRSPGHLHNKFSEAMSNYEVTCREWIALSKRLPSRRPIEAMCAQFDGAFLALPEGMPGDDDVLQDYLDIIRQMGELSLEFTEARADGIIEPAEFAAIELRAHRTVAAIMHMVKDLESTVREVPKAAPALAAIPGGKQ